jgi:outer membrane protein TolC
MNGMKKLLLIILSFSVIVAEAQKRITIEEAIEIALKNNYDIQISKKDLDIAKTNNTAGNAGMLPEIGISGSANYALKDVSQTLSDGVVNNYSGRGTTTLSAGAELNWTLFDGGRMFIEKRRLNEVESMGEIKFKEIVLNKISEVVAAYYNVIKQKQQLNSIKETINVNLERVKIAQAGINAGTLNKTDLLQAKIDLNVNKENALTQEVAIANGLRQLALLLAIDNNTSIDVSDTISTDYKPDKEELQNKIFSSNPDVMMYGKLLDIEKLMLKESYSTQLPRINFTAGYSISSISNSKSDPLLNQSLGPQIGGSVYIPVFQAGELKRKISLSKIGVEAAQLDFENIKLKVNTELSNAFDSFNNSRELMEIEKENFQLAKENLDICMQRMRLGESTSLEVRQAQQDYEQSATRLINFQYNLKLAETKLKQLMGDL